MSLTAIYTRCLTLGCCSIALVLVLSSIATGQNNTQAGQPHLYFFTNPGCAPCRQVEPGIEALEREGYPVTTVLLNNDPGLARQFSVDRTPTVILVANNKIAGRHAGLIDGVTLKKWFAAVGVESGQKFAGQSGGTKVNLNSSPRRSNFSNELGDSNSHFAATGNLPSTVHQGTRTAANAAEAKAMEATVRLKVEDPNGISYATGTVIHSHQGECLVMTCGHVFRDAQGEGMITAEYNFPNGQIKTAPGQLLSYDADARDIALVIVKADQSIPSVSIASQRTSVEPEQHIFSIGCDQGQDPTIRRSKIKNRAAYDGSIKYDIYGRPVNGRSGGGLFNAAGELIGVCNAAAVEVDEGIYTALETLHWQIAEVNLEHLFESNPMHGQMAANAQVSSNSQDRFAEMPVDGPGAATYANATNRHSADGNPSSHGQGLARIERSQVADGNANAYKNRISPVAWDRTGDHGGFNNRSSASTSRGGDMEVIILVRSKSQPSRTEAITLSHPSSELLNYLGTMKRSQTAQPRQIDVAQLRKRIEFTEVE